MLMIGIGDGSPDIVESIEDVGSVDGLVLPSRSRTGENVF